MEAGGGTDFDYLDRDGPNLATFLQGRNGPDTLVERSGGRLRNRPPRRQGQSDAKRGEADHLHPFERHENRPKKPKFLEIIKII